MKDDNRSGFWEHWKYGKFFLMVPLLALILVQLPGSCKMRRFVKEWEKENKAMEIKQRIHELPGATNPNPTSRIAVAHHHSTPLDLTVLDYGYNNIFIGVEAGLNATGLHNAILIGDHTSTTNNFEMVIRFKSGKEWRMPLPTNDPVSLQRFIDPSKP